MNLLRAYEWDRINFTDPIKRKRTADRMGIIEHELNDIEKKNIIGDVIKNTPNLKSRISIAEIKATLSKKDILVELIKTSLGEDAEHTKLNQFHDLINR